MAIEIDAILNLSAEDAVKDVERELQRGLSAVEFATTGFLGGGLSGLTGGNDSNARDFLRGQKEQTDALKDIANNTGRGLLGQTITGLIQGVTQNVTGRFSDTFLTAFERRSGVDSEVLGGLAGDIAGILGGTSARVAQAAFDFAGEGVNNLIDRTEILDLIPELQDAVIKAAADSLEDAEDLFDGVNRFAANLGDSLENSKDDFARVIFELADFQRLIDDFNLRGGVQSQAAARAFSTLTPSLEDALRSARPRQSARAAQEVLNRADELLANGLEGIRTQVDGQFTRVFVTPEARTELQQLSDRLTGFTEESIRAASEAVALVVSGQAQRIRFTANREGAEAATIASRLFEQLGFADAIDRFVAPPVQGLSGQEITDLETSLQKLIETPGISVEILRVGLSKIASGLTRVANIEDENLRASGERLQAQVQAFLAQPELLQNLTELRQLLLTQSNLARQELASGTDEAKQNLSAVVSELNRAQISILRSLTQSPAELQGLFQDLSTEVENLRAAIGSLDSSPFIIQTRFAVRELRESFLDAAQTGGLGGFQNLKDLQREINLLLKETRRGGAETDADELRELREGLQQLRQNIATFIREAARSSSLSLRGILESPQASAALAAEQARQGLTEAAIDGTRFAIDAAGEGVRQGSRAIGNLIVNRAKEDTQRLINPVLNAASATTKAATNVLTGTITTIAGSIQVTARQLQEAEEALFETVKAARTLKGIATNVIAPIAAFGALTQIPGLEGLGNLPEFLQTLTAPLTQAFVDFLNPNKFGGAISGAEFRSLQLLGGVLSKVVVGQLAIGLATGTIKATGTAIRNALPQIIQDALKTELPDDSPVTAAQLKQFTDTATENIRGLLESFRASQEGTQELSGLLERIPVNLSPQRIQQIVTASGDVVESARQLSTGLRGVQGEEVEDSLKDALDEVERIRRGTVRAYETFNQALVQENNELATQIAATALANQSQVQGRLDQIIGQLSGAQIDPGVIQGVRATGGDVDRITAEFARRLREDLLDTASPELRRQLFREYEKVGNFALAGFLLGIDTEEAERRANELGKGFLDELRRVLRIASPSKETENIGEEATEGFERGTDEDEWRKRGSQVGSAFLFGIRETFAGIGTVLNRLINAELDDIPEGFQDFATDLGNLGANVASVAQEGFSRPFREAEETNRGFVQTLKETTETFGFLEPIVRTAGNAFRTFGRLVDLAERGLGQFGLSIGTVVTALVALRVASLAVEQAFFAIENAIENFITGIIEAGSQVGRFNNTVQLLIGAQDAAIGFEIVTEAANENAVAIGNLQETYTELIGALAGGGLEDQVNDFTRIFAQTARFFNLSVDQQERLSKALRDIAGRGIVSQEEIRQQAAEALAAFPRIAADAFNTTQQQFNDLVRTGTLTALEFLPAVFAELDEVTRGAANGLAAVNNQLLEAEKSGVALSNTTRQLQVSLAEAIAPAQIAIIDSLTLAIQGLTDILPFLLIQLRSVVVGFGVFFGLRAALPILRDFERSLEGVARALLNLNFREVFRNAQQAISGFVVALRQLNFRQITRQFVSFSQNVAKTITAGFKAATISVLGFLSTLEGFTTVITFLIETGIDLAATYEKTAARINRSADEIARANAELRASAARDTEGELSAITEAVERNNKAFRDGLGFTTRFLDALAGIATFGQFGIVEEFFANVNRSAVQNVLNDANDEVERGTQLLEELAEGRRRDPAAIEAQQQALRNYLNVLKSQRPITEEQQKANQDLIASTEGLIDRLGRELEVIQNLKPELAEVVAETTKLAEINARTFAAEEAAAAQAIADGNKEKAQADRELNQIRLRNLQQNLAQQQKILDQFASEGITSVSDFAPDAAKELIEQFEKAEDEVTKLTKEEAEQRIKIQKDETDARIEELERLTDEAVDEEKARTQAAELAIKERQAAGELTEEQAARELEEIRDKSLADQIANIDEEIARVQASGLAREEIEERVADLKLEKGQLAIESVDAEIEAQQRLADEQEQAAEDAKQQQEEAARRRQENEQESLELRQRSLQLEQEALNQQTRSLERVVELAQQRFNLAQAFNQAQAGRDNLLVARLERGLEIQRRLASDEEIGRRERVALQREALQLGVRAGESELSLQRRILRAELQGQQRAIESAQLELELKQRTLEIEQQQAQLESDRAILSLQSEQLDAERELAEARNELAQAQQDQDRVAQANAREAIDIAQRQIQLISRRLTFEQQVNDSLEDRFRQEQEILDIQTQQTEDARRQNQLFQRQDRRRAIAAARDDRGGARLRVPQNLDVRPFQLPPLQTPEALREQQEQTQWLIRLNDGIQEIVRTGMVGSNQGVRDVTVNVESLDDRGLARETGNALIDALQQRFPAANGFGI